MRYYQRRSHGQPRKRYSEKEYEKLNVPDLKRRSDSGDDKSASAKKAAKRTGLIKKISAIAAALVVIAGASIFIPILSANAAYGEGYEVFLNGQSLGVVSDPQPVQQALDSIRQEFQQNYGMQISDDTLIEFKKVKISNQYICPPDVYVQLLRQTIDVKVMAWVISVNSRPAVALKTQEEAQQVLDRILAPYLEVADENARTETGFVENVEVTNIPTEYSNVTDVDSAYKIMVYGSADYEEKWHIVVTGETLSEIAHRYGLKVNDLKKANLSVAATDKIYPGDELLAVRPNNCVNVKFVETINRDEDYEAEPVIIPDDTMYVTQKRVQQEGIPGRRHIVASTVYINGIEASYTIDENQTQILQEAVPEILVKGTKEVPAIVEMAAEGRMPLPIERGSYTITSKFGLRDTGIEGASTNHKGVDLAADKGTPIYASASGTVTFAGSSSGYGLLVKIDHGGGVETRYGHCSQLLVEKGEKVEKGQRIALVGSTGVSSGSHCHFEIRINGEPVDPLG